jgi:hypothetical protein
MSYNATVYRYDRNTGEEIGIFVAEVNDAGQMLRSSAVQFTGLEGSPRYDAYLRRTGDRFRIVRDGCQGFRDRLHRLNLPPRYQR